MLRKVGIHFTYIGAVIVNMPPLASRNSTAVSGSKFVSVLNTVNEMRRGIDFQVNKTDTFGLFPLSPDGFYS